MKRVHLSLSHIISGFVAVLVGFTSSVLIVFQAAHHAGANPQEMSSWLFALGASIGLTSIGFSWFYKMPILIGWSTPGAALLATSLTGVSMAEAVGAFVFSSILTLFFAATGLFERLIKVVPKTITSAMLAGILLRFGMDVFNAFQQDIQLVGIMIMTYLVGRRFSPRYVIVWVLLVGLLDAASRGLFTLEHFEWDFSTPMFTKPEFKLATLLSVGIPLCVVTMTSQYMPGLGVLTSAGYLPRVTPIACLTSLSNLIFAPFGCFSISLAAITAAICSGVESDNNPRRRYKSTMVAGFFWLLIAAFGTTVVAIFMAFPKAFVATIAGLALFNTIGSSLSAALYHENDREAAIITLLVTTSGINIYGIAAPFWGLIAGIVSLSLLTWQKESLV